MQTRTTRLSMLLVGLLLGALITWTPPVIAAGGGSSDEADLQAQAIQVNFDSMAEQTVVTWQNIDTANGTLWSQLQNTYYHLYRSSSPINQSTIQAGQAQLWANVSACTAINIMDCRGAPSGTHPGHSETYPLPAGTNGTFYYAIVTYYQPTDTIIGNFVHGESNVSEGVEELTNTITAPFFVQAEYDSTLSVTDISWVNLNTIVPDSLPEVGPMAYTIKVYRHQDMATRSQWPVLMKEQIATLDAGDTSFRHNVPPGTDYGMFYTVTYEYNGYEDVRLLGTNTLTNAIHEDNIPPEAIVNVQASFSPESSGGTGNTTIAWDDIPNENGETYHIWRSGMPINDTTSPEVELIGEIGSGYEFYRHQIDRGMIGLAYYAVTASDSNGNHNNSVAGTASIGEGNGIFEDTFNPWFAEPTWVTAEYLGNSQTTITWTDQLGVEGEQYHIWRSSERLTYLSNLELVAELVATVPDSVETVTVTVPPDEVRTSYYCVSSVAQYSHSAEPYEDLRFQRNCANGDGTGTASPIIEDTLRPSLPFLQEATMTDQAGSKITLLRWLNDITESGETYQLWVHYGDPFFGNESLSSGDIALDSEWQPVLDPVYAEFNNEPDFTRTVALDANLNQETWYALTITDEWGNTNTQFAKSSNARSVTEDTTPAEITIEVVDGDDNVVTALHAGQYTMNIYSNEPLLEYPIINLTTSDYISDNFDVVLSGQSFTDQSATERATPISNVPNGYKFNFEIPATTDTSQLRLILAVVDNSGNLGEIDVTGWEIDAQNPEIQVYAPTSNSLYLYGESVHIYGAVTDDVGIDSVQIRFQYYDNGLRKDTVWTNVTDLTPFEGEDGAFVFEWWEPASTFIDTDRNQKVFLRATDTADNLVEWETQFTVDHCVRIIVDFSTACDGQTSLEPGAIEDEEEPGMLSMPYLMIYILGAVNLILLIIAMLSLVLQSTSGAKKKSEDGEEDEDWMMEFMGGGGDTGAGSPDDVRNDMASLSEDATERAEAEDPFAASEGRDRKRRTKKDKKDKKEVVEEEADDSDEEDEFDDEDDWDDEDEEPKKKSVKRKSVKRKSVKRRK